LGQRLGLARKPNPILQFVLVHSLPPAETEASSTPASQAMSPKRRWPPVPRPTDVNANIRKILVDGAVSSCQTALDETSRQKTFAFGHPALSQYYC
jgi:hypothetical protein